MANNHTNHRRYRLPTFRTLFPQFAWGRRHYGTSIKTAIQHQKQIFSNTYITNRSTHILTPSERSVLSKGLSFVPTPIHPHRSLTHAQAQVTDIYNKHKYFHRHPYIAAPRTHPFHKRSSWVAPTDNSAPQPPSDADYHTSQSHVGRYTVDNLTAAERQALHSLMHNRYITIKKSDKGGGITIMNTTDYIVIAFGLNQGYWYLHEVALNQAFVPSWFQCSGCASKISRRFYVQIWQSTLAIASHLFTWNSLGLLSNIP